MPVLSMFYGIVIKMYWKDSDQHHSPHLHAEYQGEEAVFEIPTGTVLAGKIPRGKKRLVQAWIEIHKDELVQNWELALHLRPTFSVDPLR
ncbi:MAG: DUF4160 domain-containing protein [Thermoguttaceae bacterium]